MSGIARDVMLSGWQRQTILAAAALIQERFGNPPTDPKARATHEGLLELLDPRRRALRLERELGLVPKFAVKNIKSERREGRLRRRPGDRRCANAGSPNGLERRRGQRRTSADRRSRK